MSDDVNYIPYFSEVEDTFIRLREKSLFLSPTDWALIASWQERGIPLHIVLGSIEEVFRYHKSAARRRGISSLRYCQAEVEEQFQQYMKSRVGAHESVPGAVATGSSDPFSKENVVAHLERVTQLLVVSAKVPEHAEEFFGWVREELVRLKGQIDAISIQKLEEELTELDRVVDLTLQEEASVGARAKVEEQLKPYKTVMPADVYERQSDILLKKLLRDVFAVPRLSLFHMK